MYALEHRTGRSRRWGWMLASGILDIVLGLLLLIGLPGTALWALTLMALHARPARLGAPA